MENKTLVEKSFAHETLLNILSLKGQWPIWRWNLQRPKHWAIIKKLTVKNTVNIEEYAYFHSVCTLSFQYLDDWYLPLWEFVLCIRTLVQIGFCPQECRYITMFSSDCQIFPFHSSIDNVDIFLIIAQDRLNSFKLYI